MAPEKNPYQAIARRLRAAFEGDLERGLAAALDLILEATGSRATGLWCLEGDRLKLLSFRSAAAMPREVHRGFAEATREVSLEARNLGIVQAALCRKPHPALRQDPDVKMGGSATWLERFEAEQSLAVPVHSSGPILGVLAISAPFLFDEESSPWRLLVRLGEALAPLMEAGR